MKYVIDNEEYEVVINKKNNKNTYIRVKDKKIIVNTNYFVTKKYIINLLDDNNDFLRKALNKEKKKEEKNKLFYYLGEKYDIIIVPYIKSIDINDGMILVSSYEFLEKWLKIQIKNIFKERLDLMYSRFEENIPYPKLKIRKMKTRWGVCNIKEKCITLNSELIKYNLNEIDYVIIHELSHLIHFNHSKDFWVTVSKYCDYKTSRRILKDN